MCSSHFFSHPEWSQWLLCVSLEKLKDKNIFLEPSIDKTGWRIESSQHFMIKSQCDLTGGLNTIMRARARNKWTMMECFQQDNTLVNVLHPGCLVQVDSGSQRILTPASLSIPSTKRDGDKDNIADNKFTSVNSTK